MYVNSPQKLSCCFSKLFGYYSGDSANSKNAVVAIILIGGAVEYYSSISTVFFELPWEKQSRKYSEVIC